jgi:hypothetical protein
MSVVIELLTPREFIIVGAPSDSLTAILTKVELVLVSSVFCCPATETLGEID